MKRIRFGPQQEHSTPFFRIPTILFPRETRPRRGGYNFPKGNKRDGLYYFLALRHHKKRKPQPMVGPSGQRIWSIIRPTLVVLGLECRAWHNFYAQKQS